jgi:hypothetical protein
MNKRYLAYGAIFLCFIVAVITRQSIVTKERGADITSVNAEWKDKGKPVVVKKAVKEDVKVYAKITAVSAGNGCYYAYVPQITCEKMEVGQDVFLDNKGGDPAGKISEVSRTVDVDTGMFPVKLIMDNDLLVSGEPLIVYVNTEILKNRISLPREVITFEDQINFVWIIKNGLARKTTVEIGDHNGYAVIRHGMNEGDIVVLRGYSKLLDGDKVSILDR